MPGVVEGYAARLGWKIRRCNVIVEGTSDAALLLLAALRYQQRHGILILGDHIAIVPAGIGDDGGVDGVNRRLNAARQMADADRGSDGSLRYWFIGLYDNDAAGRRAVNNACAFDRRLSVCRDLFLLNPVMPLASGADHVALRRRFDIENARFKDLDWEIEDLLSERILEHFSQLEPNAIHDIRECSGRRHREYTRNGKQRLHQFVREHATLDDLLEILKLIIALRDYFRLDVSHIEI